VQILCLKLIQSNISINSNKTYNFKVSLHISFLNNFLLEVNKMKTFISNSPQALNFKNPDLENMLADMKNLIVFIKEKLSFDL